MKVIIPYKNNPVDLAVLLSQLQCQKVRPDGIFLIDNSKDKSGFEIAKRHQWGIPLYCQLGVGSITKSWNVGIRFAENEDVVILNDDILIPWDFILIMARFIQSGIADIYCPSVAGFPPTNRVRKFYAWHSKDKIAYHLIDKEEQKYTPSLKGWCFGLPRTTVEKIGVFDERFNAYYQDKDYEKRIFEKKGKVCFIDGLNVHHFGSSSYSKLKEKEFNNLNYTDQEKFEKKYKIKHTDFGYKKPRKKK